MIQYINQMHTLFHKIDSDTGDGGRGGDDNNDINDSLSKSATSAVLVLDDAAQNFPPDC